MKIYFAGLSGISNITRLQVWIKRGMKKSLSHFMKYKPAMVKENSKNY